MVVVLINLTFSNPKLIIETILVSFFVLVWVAYILSSARVVVKGEAILFPKQYEMKVASILAGTTFLSALSHKRRWIKPIDIESVDILVGYSVDAGVGSLHQPLTLTFKDGSVAVFYMKLFSKRFVINLLRSVRDINHNINFSKSAQELIDLKNPLTLTDTEKQDAKPKKKLVTIMILFIIVFAASYFIMEKTGQLVTNEYDIKSISIGNLPRKDIQYRDYSGGEVCD